MKYDNKIKKFESDISEIRLARGGIRYCFKEANQTEAEALAAAGIQKDAPGTTVIICKWSDSHEYPVDREPSADPEPETLEGVNQELENLKAQLRQDESLTESSGTNEKLDALQPDDDLPTEPDSQKSNAKLLTPGPLRTDDLTSFGRR